MAIHNGPFGHITIREAATRPNAWSRGFTLVEVMVAVVIGALVVTLTVEVTRTAVSGANRIRHAQHVHDRERNVQRWLISTVQAVDVGNGPAIFHGTASTLAFRAWLRTPEDWYEPRRVELFLDGGHLVAAIEDRPQLELLPSVSTLAFDYLTNLGSSAQWLDAWRSTITPPVAVRVRVTRRGGLDGSEVADTLLIVVGARG